MASNKAQTLKGFRDFAPREARKRQFIISGLRSVFESYGFEPLETPALEYEEVLLNKYGGEGNKLMYRFEDQGKRKVAMRYDQTVPLARYISQNYQTITFPFKRYQIQSVWRAENTQKGRYREFLQCDIDTVGTGSPLSDAEIIATVWDCYKALGFKNIKIVINDRSIFKNLPSGVVSILDKLAKIGTDAVLRQLKDKGFNQEVLKQIKATKAPGEVVEIIKQAQNLGVEAKSLVFQPTLARGLDYYTGIIFEVEVVGYSGGSLGGGGRYDNLIGKFGGKRVAAVGFSFGFDRIYEAMDEAMLFPSDLDKSTTTVLVASLDKFENQAMKLAKKLRDEGINTEVYLEPAKLDKQLKYADKKGIAYAVVIGPDEVKSGLVTLKTLSSGKQEKLTSEKLIIRLSSHTK